MMFSKKKKNHPRACSEVGGWRWQGGGAAEISQRFALHMSCRYLSPRCRHVSLHTEQRPFAQPSTRSPLSTSAQPESILPISL